MNKFYLQQKMINVIKASAGSGKTYRLTYEYIKLLLGDKRKGRFVLAHENEHNRHRHILAVTFTNKATGEMKERIVKELSILAGKVPGKTSPYLKDLCNDFGNISPEEVTKAAYRAMVDILFDYTNFNVSTIDSFFQMILRTFAKELKMSYNYDVELDDDYAIRVGVNDFLSGLAHDRDAAYDKNEVKRVRRVKSWIKEFIKEEVANNKSWNIFFESESANAARASFSHSFTLNDFARSLTKEELRACIDDIITYLGYGESKDSSSDYIMLFKAYLYEQIQAVKKRATYQVREIFHLSEADGLTVDDLSANGGLAWILKISDDNIDCGLGLYKTAKILESVEKSDKWFKKGKAKNPPRLSEETIGSIVHCINEIAECNALFFIYKEMHRNVFMLGLLGEISRYMSKFRKENELILLADTNELLRKIISNEDTPFVYERVGIWLSHFLIDEFQDTSKAQWENMKPLLYNSCAEGGDNLIIGDEKQCIYRFRNADPTLLRTEVGKHFTIKQNNKGKSINWRSTPQVVEFNNSFFSTIAPMLGAGEEYANVVQELPANKRYDNEGYVEVSFIDEKTKDENDSVEKKFKDIALERIPFLIKDIVSRGYEYKDIAVLVATNSEGANVIKCILDYNASLESTEQKINVISNESLLLRNSPAVRLVISHLRYFDSKKVYSETKNDSNNKIKDIDGYMHRVLRSYESLMNNKGIEPGIALEESFATVPQHDEHKAMSLSTLLPENTESFNIISITEHIIAQNISKKDLLHENAFIQAFQDCVVDFSNRQNATIHEFLKWWDGGGCNTSVNSPDGQNAINVLTIHKSKGLEFSCVILPFCEWDLEGKEEVLWIPKDVAANSGFFNNVDEKLIPPIIPLSPKIDMNLEHSGISAFYQEKRMSRIVDSLNKTYVGFTRAVDELYIFTPTPSSKTSPTKMNSLLAILPLQEDGVFTSGSKGYVTPKDCEKTETAKMPLYKVENTKIEYTVPDLYDNEQRTRGTRLHKIFKKIRNIDDVDFALRYFSAKGVIPRDCYDDDRKILLGALDDERVQEWFDSRNRVYNERSMISGMEKRRPDRFIVTPDGRTIVIDYKFGNIHKTSYRKQVQEYLDILTEIGFKNVEGYLWYPLEQYIEKVN